VRSLIAILLLGVVLQGCSVTKASDAEAALFAALFDVPHGSCRELRAQLRGEIESIKEAQKKARDDLLADAEAPPKETKSRRSLRKEDPLASLREWSKRSEQAEKLNGALKERRCRTVDIEAAVK
jgi:hypothetical protein